MVISDLCYYLTHDSDDGWHLLVIKYFFNEGVYPVFFFRRDVNIAFIYTGKSKTLCDLLYWDICFILVVWIKPQSLQGVPVSWNLDSLAHYRGEKKVHSKLQWQAEGGWRCVCAFAPPTKDKTVASSVHWSIQLMKELSWEVRWQLWAAIEPHTKSFSALSLLQLNRL